MLATVGLVVADVVTYKSQESFLFDQTDQTLQADHRLADYFTGQHGGPGPIAGRQNPLPPGYVVEFRDATTGKIVQGPYVNHVPGAQTPPLPKLPATISLSPPTEGEPDAVRYFTASALSGGGRYRVRASLDPGVELAARLRRSARTTSTRRCTACS